MTFDFMATTAALLYLLGAGLHYIYVFSIFYLLEQEDEMIPILAFIHSIIWPWTVIKFLWLSTFGGDDD